MLLFFNIINMKNCASCLNTSEIKINYDISNIIDMYIQLLFATIICNLFCIFGLTKCSYTHLNTVTYTVFQACQIKEVVILLI